MKKYSKNLGVLTLAFFATNISIAQINTNLSSTTNAVTRYPTITETNEMMAYLMPISNPFTV